MAINRTRSFSIVFLSPLLIGVKLHEFIQALLFSFLRCWYVWSCTSSHKHCYQTLRIDEFEPVKTQCQQCIDQRESEQLQQIFLFQDSLSSLLIDRKINCGLQTLESNNPERFQCRQAIVRSLKVRLVFCKENNNWKKWKFGNKCLEHTDRASGRGWARYVREVIDKWNYRDLQIKSHQIV